MRTKHVIQAAALAGLSLLALAPQSFAAGVGNMFVRDGNMSVTGSNTDLKVQFTTASVNGGTTNSGFNGHGTYIQGDFWNGGQGFQVQTNRHNGEGYAGVGGANGFGAPTAGPWYAHAKTCADVPWWFDPCSGWTGIVNP